MEQHSVAAEQCGLQWIFGRERCSSTSSHERSFRRYFYLTPSCVDGVLWRDSSFVNKSFMLVQSVFLSFFGALSQ